MEASSVKTVVQSQNIKSTQPVRDKNTISDVESFKNTLKELETPQVSNDVKTDSKPSENINADKTQNANQFNNEGNINQTLAKEENINPVVNKEQNPNLQSVEPNINPVVNKEQNSTLQSVEPNINQSIEQLLLQNISEQTPQNVLVPNQTNEIADINLPEKQVMLPQVTQMVKEIQELPQKSEKPSKMFETKISKQLGFEKEEIGNELKVLEEGLKTVSLDNVDKQVFENDKVAFQQSLIAEIGDTTKAIDNKIALQSLSELNSKISAINSISTVSNKTKNLLGSIKMNKEDANFFVNMVENQSNNNFQANITMNVNNQVTFTDVKSQALQSSASVSQALIEKLQESMNTNKAFRVDFDNDVAVIMRVDSNGTLSANFIPGSSAVEQYLRNNIAELKQAFENKGLEYNELTYSSKKQNQQKQQQQEKNRKGGQDE
jgi:hypothetical protein